MLRFLLTRSSIPKPRRGAAAGFLALAAIGGCAALASLDDRPSIGATISISPSLVDWLSRASELFWKEYSPSPLFSNPPGEYYAPSHSVASAFPSNNPDKEGIAENNDDSTCCRGCLGRNSIANAAAAVGPAVVNISVSQGYPGIILGRSIGSGTIIDPDGTILTCAHVVVDFQSTRSVYKGKVGVTLQDGRQFEGTVMNADFHSDIALVKIKSKTPLPAAKLGSSRKLRPGDWVVALGCPHSLQNTITAGIVRQEKEDQWERDWMSFRNCWLLI